MSPARWLTRTLTISLILADDIPYLHENPKIWYNEPEKDQTSPPVIPLVITIPIPSTRWTSAPASASAPAPAPAFIPAAIPTPAPTATVLAVPTRAATPARTPTPTPVPAPVPSPLTIPIIISLPIPIPIPVSIPAPLPIPFSVPIPLPLSLAIGTPRRKVPPLQRLLLILLPTPVASLFIILANLERLAQTLALLELGVSRLVDLVRLKGLALDGYRVLVALHLG